MPAGVEERAQVDRILQTETFHSSAVLRRLLRFLADKAFSGEADQLNEYSIGVDALGKPTTYDPRQTPSYGSMSAGFAKSWGSITELKEKMTLS